jgi:hypothetical protein
MPPSKFLTGPASSGRLVLRTRANDGGQLWPFDNETVLPTGMMMANHGDKHHNFSILSN